MLRDACFRKTAVVGRQWFVSSVTTGRCALCLSLCGFSSPQLMNSHVCDIQVEKHANHTRERLDDSERTVMISSFVGDTRTWHPVVISGILFIFGFVFVTILSLFHHRLKTFLTRLSIPHFIPHSRRNAMEESPRLRNTTNRASKRVNGTRKQKRRTRTEHD